ncbi:uncharacterized protein LOC18011921 isoform X3 [Eutrema salsugineum]|uniref:uncharacterized protein LOC18011921 isoform X3 n=1 Tax=Eutrema salsugineum TaxID=72664 RepID=UPI000CED1BA6|nr:uncharacterized protein LOC18011921 isoform X3 [Eutrema salsugineum]
MVSWRKLVSSQFSVILPSLFSSSPLQENSTAPPPAIAWPRSSSVMKYNMLMNLKPCKLEETNGDNISIESLISLEEQFKTALSVTRARKNELMMELVKTLQEKEKMLRAENQVLVSQLTKVSYRWRGKGFWKQSMREQCHRKIAPATILRRLSRFSNNQHHQIFHHPESEIKMY